MASDAADATDGAEVGEDPVRSAVVVYDGDCPFCDAVATALRRLPDAGAVQWDAEPAQAFLSAQFDEVPYATFLVDADEGRVYAGRAAAREVCERAGMPVLLQDVVGDNYERLSDAVRSVAGLDRDPDPYHEGYPLADEARERVPALAAAARNPGVDHLDR